MSSPELPQLQRHRFLLLRPVTEAELHSWGVNVVIYANHMLRAAYPAMTRVARAILENGRAQEVRDYCMPIKEI